MSVSCCSPSASVGCAVAPGIAWLIFFRFVQGVGAAPSWWIPRAIIRDLHTGIEATRLMSLVMLVLSVSPILAPLTGSALIVPFGWRAVFRRGDRGGPSRHRARRLFLPETRPPEERIAVSIGSVARTASGSSLVHGRFLALTLHRGLGMAEFSSPS